MGELRGRGETAKRGFKATLRKVFEGNRELREEWHAAGPRGCKMGGNVLLEKDLGKAEGRRGGAGEEGDVPRNAESNTTEDGVLGGIRPTQKRGDLKSQKGVEETAG